MKNNTSTWERWLQTQTPIVADEEKEEAEITPRSSLPDEIIMDIFSRLPAKSILRFRCVCKHWRNNLFKDPSFTKTHLKTSIAGRKFNCFAIRHPLFTINHSHEFSIYNRRKSSQLPTFEDGCFEPMYQTDIPVNAQLVMYPYIWIDTHGSCNGFILLRSRSGCKDVDLRLWNPTTKEFKIIQLDSEEELRRNGVTGQYKLVKYGFGYNCDTDDYKIVKLARGYQSDCDGSEVQVYTLGLDSWRTLPDMIPYVIHSDSTHAFVHGALHWIATRWNSSASLILSFDIGDEKFREVPLTSQVEELFRLCHDRGGITLGVLGGCLCVVFSGSSEFQVWVMKDQKRKESWTRLFMWQHPIIEEKVVNSMTLLWELENGKIVFKVDAGSGTYGGTYFLVYDLVHPKRKVSGIYPMSGYYRSIQPYVESLVSISGTYVGWEQEFPTL